MSPLAEIVPFTSEQVASAQIARWNSSEVMTAGSDAVSLVGKAAYVGTPIYQGSFGVTSFGIVIPRVDEARPGWWDNNEPYVDYYDTEEKRPIHADPIRNAHWQGTKNGFQVIRVVLVPKPVSGLLKQDKFLGPALIDKCTFENTLPDDFDEELKGYTGYCMSYETYEEAYGPLLKAVLKGFEALNGTTFERVHEIPSWHSYLVYEQVRETVARACELTVGNFDHLMAMLTPTAPRLHNFDKGEVVGLVVPDRGELASPADSPS